MTIYYLMIKTHNITGLKYLCQTKQKDPINYTGSGVDWKIHLKEHGRDIRTSIIKASTDKHIINELGRHLSNLWKITTAMNDYGDRIWANKIPETGGGAGVTSDIAKQRYVDHPELIEQFKKTMTLPQSVQRRRKSRAVTVSQPEFREKFKSTMKLAMNRPEVRLNNSINQTKAQNRPDVKLNKSIKQTEAQNRPEVKLLKSKNGKIAQNRPEVKDSKSGKNNYRYDPTIRTFIHSDGTIEKMPANDFSLKYNLDRGWLSNVILGNRKTIKGWSVKVQKVRKELLPN
jgi:hypothetical protein